MNYKTDDLRIQSIKEVISPAKLHEEYLLSEQAAKTILATRHAIHDILQGENDRVLVIIGPCSIHDVQAAKEYAERLRSVRQQLADDLLIVMRVYFEKPRTTVGWKGLINDPDLDGSFKINKGLRLARDLLLNLNNMDMPAAVEYLDLITPQYIADLVSWGAIGARTTESQVHRELASGLSCPVGFKNGTDGNLKVAVDAVRAAQHPHSFLSLTKDGHSAIFSTAGNLDSHVILRGGTSPNYDAGSIRQAAQQLAAAGLAQHIMVDLSHSNSQKQYDRQLIVGRDVAEQIAQGNDYIMGLMIESHLQAGRQDVIPGKPLTYGQSITDACIGWEESSSLLEQIADAVRKRRKAASKA